MAELRRAVYLSPYEAQAHLLIGRIHLRAGRTAAGGRRAEDLDLEPGDRRRRALALAEAYLKLQNTAAGPDGAGARAGARSRRRRRRSGCSPAIVRQMTACDCHGQALWRGVDSVLLSWAPAGWPRSSAAPGRLHRRSGRHHPAGHRRVPRPRIEQADAAGAALLVITLRTPGGLLDTTRDINNAIIAAKTPVAVFVGPSGQPRRVGRLPHHHGGRRRRDGAGHAHRRRASRLGRRREDRRGDGEEDGVRHRQLRADARRSSASATPTLIEQAVTESRSFTEQEALSAAPPLIDVVATDVPDLLRKLDGRTVTRFDGRSAGACGWPAPRCRRST